VCVLELHKRENSPPAPALADLGTHALGANAANGLRRSPADKQRAIEVCVKEFPELTQAKIAEMVGCSIGWVNKVKSEIHTEIEIPATITTARGQTRPTQYARKPSIFAPDAPEADGRAFIRPCQPCA